MGSCTHCYHHVGRAAVRRGIISVAGLGWCRSNLIERTERIRCSQSLVQKT